MCSPRGGPPCGTWAPSGALSASLLARWYSHAALFRLGLAVGVRIGAGGWPGYGRIGAEVAGRPIDDAISVAVPAIVGPLEIVAGAAVGPGGLEIANAGPFGVER